MAGAPDPKPPKRKRKQIRVIDTKATTRAVLREPTCACCQEPSATGHHVLARGAPHFGDDVPENIVALCGSGTTGCHGKVEGADAMTRTRLGIHILTRRPDTLAYLREKLNVTGDGYADEWLKRHLHVAVA